MLKAPPNNPLALLWRARMKVRVVHVEFALTLASPATGEGNG